MSSFADGGDGAGVLLTVLVERATGRSRAPVGLRHPRCREASLRSSRPPSHEAWESTAGSNSFRGLWPTDRTH